MKKIYILALALMAAVTSCHSPKHVEPTAERQGLTQLSAIFTFGPYVDQEMCTLNITDETQTKFVIPIPYYYPEESLNESTPYLKKMKVTASIDANCEIDPPLGILDLTQEHWFTYTNAQGKKTKICITGERTKSSACDLTAFSIVDPAIPGVIDQSNNSVMLVTVEDLASCVAEASISAHATISPDPSEPRDYNSPVDFTVTAHNGVDKKVYTVKVGVPEKIDKGFNSNTVEQLFNLEPQSRMGLLSYKSGAAPSMAKIGNNLVVSPGNGADPIYVNGLTGTPLGTIANPTGGEVTVASDEAGHLLFFSIAAGYAIENIYMTTSVTQAPVLVGSFDNVSSFPIGHKVKIIGDVSKNAAIVFTCEGVEGAGTRDFVLVKVTDGVIGAPQEKSIQTDTYYWGPAPVNIATVVAASEDPDNDGYFVAGYETVGFGMHYIGSDLSIAASLPSSDSSRGNFNQNCLDSKKFNNVNYVALLVVSHFPIWGAGPKLYLYNVDDKDNLSGSFEDCPALVLSNDSIEWYQKAENGTAAGDVIIAPSEDGFKIYIYYYDLNSGAIGAYSADCIKR